MAFARFREVGLLKRDPMPEYAAAISAGVWEGACRLDLNYHEDKDAEVDFNYVMTEGNAIVEVQGSGEEATFTEEQMTEMLQLGKKGISELVTAQRELISGFDPTSDADLLERIASRR